MPPRINPPIHGSHADGNQRLAKQSKEYRQRRKATNIYAAVALVITRKWSDRRDVGYRVAGVETGSDLECMRQHEGKVTWKNAV